MLHATHRVTGAILWANLHLLFWLSLVPFITSWMGSNHFAPVPSALYGVVMLMAAIAYYILKQAIIASQEADSLLKRAIGRDWKGKVSPALYALAIPVAFLSPWVSLGLYVGVALSGWYRTDASNTFWQKIHNDEKVQLARNLGESIAGRHGRHVPHRPLADLRHVHVRELLLQHGCVFVAIEQHHHIGSVQVLALELVWVTCSLLKGKCQAR